jgi:hypothetical protein
MDNWSRTGKVIKETFSMARKHPLLYLPPIASILASAVFIMCAIATITLGASFGLGEAPILAWVIALFFLFLSYAAGAFFSAALSWMVLETVRGKQPHFGKGLSRAGKKAGSLLIYAAISLIVMLLANQLRSSDRDSILLAIVRNLFASMVEKAWDIASHLLLPAIVLTDHNFGTAAKELPKMIDHLPQVLVGGFAFDFVVGWLYIIELVMCILLFFLIGGSAGFFIGLILFVVLATLTYVLYLFCKSVYFTMLYIDLHPELKK